MGGVENETREKKREGNESENVENKAREESRSKRLTGRLFQMDHSLRKWDMELSSI